MLLVAAPIAAPTAIPRVIPMLITIAFHPKDSQSPIIATNTRPNVEQPSIHPKFLTNHICRVA
jgi:hypothetical protein